MLTPLQNNLLARLATSTIALTGSGCAIAMSKGSFRTAQRRQDVQDVSDFAFTQNLYDGMAHVSLDTPVLTWKPTEWFNLDDLFTKRDLYPHVMVLGTTGDGKTTLVEYMLDRDRTASKLYISPTRDDNEFLDYRTYGCGIRSDRPYSFDFEEITKALNYLGDLTVARYQMSAEQVGETESLDAVIDEYRLAAKVGDDVDGRDMVKCRYPYQLGSKEVSYAQMVAFIATVARKRRIRLWLLTHSELVKALKMEGEGDIRENFGRIRLGGLALAHLKKLVEQGVYPSEAIEWWKEQDRHTVGMFEDSFFRIPYLEGYKEMKRRAYNFNMPQGTPYIPQPPHSKLPHLGQRSANDDARVTSTVIQDVTEIEVPPDAPNVATRNLPENFSGETSENQISDFSIDYGGAHYEFKYQDILSIVKDVGMKKSSVAKRLNIGSGGKYTHVMTPLWNSFCEWRSSNL